MATRDLHLNITAKDHASKVLKGVGVAATAAAAAVAAVGTAFIKLGEQGARVNSLTAAFDNFAKQAGVTAGVLQNQLDTAFMGVISKAEQAKLANESFTAGLKPDQITLMAKASVQLSKRLGIDVVSAYRQLNNAMARGSSMQLKKLGITIDAKRAQEEYAKKLGKSVKELTAEEKQAALTEAAMSKLKTKVQEGVQPTIDFGDSLDIMKSSLKNVTDRVGSFIDKNFGPYMAELAKQTKKASNNIKGLKNPIDTAKNAIDKVLNVVWGLGRAFIIVKGSIVGAFKVAASIITTSFTAALYTSLKPAQLLVALFAKITHNKPLEKFSNDFKKKMTDLKDYIEDTNPVVVIEEQVKQTNKELDNFDNAMSKAAKTTQKTYQEQRQAAGKVTKEVKKGEKEQQEAVKQTTKVLKEKLSALDAADRITSAFSNLSSSLDSAFSTMSDNISNVYDKQKEEIDKNKQKELDAIDTKIKSEKRRAQLREQIERKYAAQKAKIDKEEEERKKKIAKIQKEIRIAQAVAEGAMAVIKAWDNPFPLNIVMAALTAAAVGIQIATIKAQPYATGGLVTGSGTSTSDSIPAMLSNGEYVVNADATRRNLPILEAINRGGSPVTHNVTITLVNPQIINSDEFIMDEFVPKLNNLVERGLNLKASEVI